MACTLALPKVPIALTAGVDQGAAPSFQLAEGKMDEIG